jgi:hypothetical protein
MYKHIKDARACSRRHYARNKAEYIARNKVRRLRNQIFIKEYLVVHPCVDCKCSDIRCLEFDHIRGDKEFCISLAVRDMYSLERIQKEIEKCEVRCANCHKIRHSKERDIVS